MSGRHRHQLFAMAKGPSLTNVVTVDIHLAVVWGDYDVESCLCGWRVCGMVLHFPDRSSLDVMMIHMPFDDDRTVGTVYV
jgi:hypothetical protein